jgi:hypothetical protein
VLHVYAKLDGVPANNHQSSMLAQAHTSTSGESIIVRAVLVFLPFTVFVVTNNITGIRCSVHVSCIRSNSRKLGC